MSDSITRGIVTRWAILLVLGSGLVARAQEPPAPSPSVSQSALQLATGRSLSTNDLSQQTPAAPPTEPLTLEAAFDRALNANPTIAAARLRRAINVAGITVAGERPNPEVHAEIEKETPKQDFGV